MRTRTQFWAAAVFALGGAVLAQSTQNIPLPPPMRPILPSVPEPTPAATTLPAPPPGIVPVPPAPPTVTTLPVAAPAPERSATGSATSPATVPATGGEPASQLGKVVVSAESDLDLRRIDIAPALGAQTYDIGPAQIQNIPGGETATFKDVLLRAPGVVEDSFGQEHVRGEHGNLTYRVNGVLLPEPVSGFGQELDTRLVNSVTLIDGSLPAQFGFHTAGIVDVQTKSGDTLNHNELSLYGGSYDTFEPSIQIGGTIGKFDYFVTASSNHNDLGIENPTGTHRPLHDYSDQEKIFGYFAYRLDDTSRITLLMNASYSDFQIPDTRGIPQAFDLAGHPYADSAKINEEQNEQEYYTVLSYQKSVDKLSFQVSGFTRYGQITFYPDVTRDLIFQGVGGAVYNNFYTNGIQFDSSYVLNDQHTIRAGLLADYTTEELGTDTAVFAVNPATGAQTSNVPFDIVDNSENRALEAGVYVQDEWHINRQFTLNYGLRYDRFDANFDDEDQVSPRANLVWKIDRTTTAHAGYARYFVTPPVQDVHLAEIEKFAGTTNAPQNFIDDAPRVEKSNYFDLGVSRQVTKPLLIGVDGFYKQAHNLIDLGQFGAPVIESPFNYKRGVVEGAEFSSTYTNGGASAFGNFSWVKTMAHDIDTQEFLIDNAELDFIKDHNIHLDHESEFTVSAGAAYAWKHDRVYLDFLYESGLRGGFANTHQLQQHYPVNTGYEHIFHPAGMNGHAVKFRLDLLNVFDEKYQIRNGSGIGVGAPQYGTRRAIYAGVTYEF